jgi:acyl-CoA synthetase (NDP forming)
MTRDMRPFFKPSAAAVFGASGRPGRPGYESILSLKAFPDGPRIYPVTPGYADIDGVTCYPNAAALPEKIDLAVIASGPARVIDDAHAAISAGAKALHVVGDLVPEEIDRLAKIARDADIALLGPNSIGYVDYASQMASTWMMPPEDHRRQGNIALLLQSGALFSYANSIDPRLSFATTIHLGREAGVTLVDMIDHMLTRDETRVIGIYLENVGDGRAFGDALMRARLRDVPVVVLAPGQTPEAAEAIATHAGRMAGGKAALEALFRRNNVVECHSLDQLWCTLHLLSTGVRFNGGGLGIVTDSGAQRAMAIDAASRLKLPLARFSETTELKLREILAPELSTENPIDIWSGEHDVSGHVEACLATVIADENTGIGTVITEFGVPLADTFSTRIAEGLERLADNAKPVLAIGFSTRHFVSDRIMKLEQSGVPVLDGLETSFVALSQLNGYETASAYSNPLTFSPEERLKIETALEALVPDDELSALEAIEAAGIAAVKRRVATSLQDAIVAAETIGYPVVLKTAEAVAHKTEVNGVWLDIRDGAMLERAYNDLSTRIGPRVLVASMLKGGIELALGAVIDPVAGPMVMVAAGGVMAELLADRQFALAPVSKDEARDMLRALKISPTFEPWRGKPGIDLDAVASAIASLSQMIAEYSHSISAIDINPVIATPSGMVAVDALFSRADAAHTP